MRRGIKTSDLHITDQSRALKGANPDISLCHVHDRGCDSVEYLEFITETLGDDAKRRVYDQTGMNSDEQQ